MFKRKLHKLYRENQMVGILPETYKKRHFSINQNSWLIDILYGLSGESGITEKKGYTIFQINERAFYRRLGGKHLGDLPYMKGLDAQKEKVDWGTFTFVYIPRKESQKRRGVDISVSSNIPEECLEHLVSMTSENDCRAIYMTSWD